MRFRPVIAKCVALFLVLIFAQKSGAGLFLHNLLHTPTAQTENPSSKNERSNEISYACSCVDDLLMPFIEPDSPAVSAPILQYGTTPAFYLEGVCFHPVIFSALRGPPSAIL